MAPIEYPSGPPVDGWFLADSSHRGVASIDVELSIVELKNHARAAMQIELTTIPLYLYAAYSIPSNTNSAAGLKTRKSIIGIVKQEMLHLALAGNIIRALDSYQDLYDPDFIPQYTDESHILYDHIDVNLNQATKPELLTFMKIEAPYAPTPNRLYTAEHDTAPEYHSIGEFYDEFLNGLKIASHSHGSILSHNPEYQFTAADAFPRYMSVIRDFNTVKSAITLIIEQGEGGGPVKPEESHHEIFRELYNSKESWDCYPVPKNPTTEDYKGNDYIYHLSRAFDALFCYLLQSIDRIWKTSRETQKTLRTHLIVKLLFGIMGPKGQPSVMNQLADVLVQTKLGEGRNAAPTFNYYPPNGAPLPPLDLWRAIQTELKTVLATPASKKDHNRQYIQEVLNTVSVIPPFP